MSSLLRLSKTFRTLRTPESSRTLSSHFVYPSHTSRYAAIPRPRFYSSGGYGGYQAQVTKNHAILYGLMGTNIAVFGYACYLKMQATQGYQVPFVKFMDKMALNLTTFLHGNYFSMLTSVFTHVDIGHIFSNMFTVYFMGSFLASAPIITPFRYLTIALGSGLAGSVGYLFNRYYQLQAEGPHARDYTRGIGFSGAVMGISTVAACLAPHSQVLIYGIVPMPLWALVTGYAIYDGYYVNSTNSRIGHAGHLGGLAFGLVYYFARLRGLRV
ncbi:hypothetical protein G6011_10899 [Alternaria panax]|uniref:Peptidase S54 rhomboid domain-containing protein n=1 Tax=Alternaria panax TaxID=48097 RepID=A0AAD4ICR0_9PLEO|nr:hypothetical protein G6011_10899 [Alternaria panax]